MWICNFKTITYGSKKFSTRNQLKHKEQTPIRAHCCKQNANPDVSPFTRLYLIQEPRCNNRAQNTGNCKCKRRGKYEKFPPPEKKNTKKKQSETLPSCLPYFPWRYPPTNPSFPGNGKYCDKAHYRLNTSRYFNVFCRDQVAWRPRVWV